jgi:hypothetical protein
MTICSHAKYDRPGYSLSIGKMGIVLSVALLGMPVMGQFRDDGIVTPDLPAIPSATMSSSLSAASPFSSTTTLSALSEPQAGRTLYRWSVAAVLAGNTADLLSSWHRPEANPVLANPGTRFNAESAALKSGFVGASLLIEYWALRHNRRLYKVLAWMNYAVAGGLGVVVEHNLTVQ